MNSMRIGWKKEMPSELQYNPSDKQCSQKSFEKLSKPTIKSNKKVQFNCQTLLTKRETFENEKYNPSRTLGLKQSMSEDYNPIDLSTNVYSSDVPIADAKICCSARGVVLTFIIVVLIISAAAITVGVTISSTKSSLSSTGTANGNNNNNNNNNNQNSGISVSTVLTTAITSSVSIGSQNGAPCSTYTTINDPTRSINQNGTFSSCDRGSLFNATNGGSWIRFVGIGGTIMATTSPGNSNCGAYVSAWFNDTLPTVVGTIYNGTVCLSGNLQPCFFMMTISVVNCGSFYVYFLPPMPFCNGRYCTA